jgi:hypothetical protein
MKSSFNEADNLFLYNDVGWMTTQPISNDVGMSATATGSSAVAILPHERCKVVTTRIKITNFSIHEDNFLCKSWP